MKGMRTGITTGTCAAAAAQAAARLLTGNRLDKAVTVDLPEGTQKQVPVYCQDFSSVKAVCYAVKDAGDDPDVTHGIKILAEARFTQGDQIAITGGEGIGVVTKPGLKIPVGHAAINPVPLWMIKNEVRKITDKALSIVISAQGGKEISEKTLNQKLGIVGGISILGTTGIVKPMSEDGWIGAVNAEIGVLKAGGRQVLCFVPGNMGKKMLQAHYLVERDCIITVSNYIGAALEIAAEKRINGVLLAGHLGKLVKVSGGILNTHSKTADGRMEILCAYAGLQGADKKVLEAIYHCVTTDAAAEVIYHYGLCGVFQMVAEKARQRCEDAVNQALQAAIIIFDSQGRILAETENAQAMAQALGGGK